VKKLIAILLLGLLLYNSFGYYLLFAYESEKERISFLSNMPESSFEVLKFKIAVYTSIADTEVEYVNEDLIAKNKTYRIVKKFVKNDTLNLFYLRNHKQDELRESLYSIIESQAFDKDFPKESPVKKIVKSFLKDYIPDNIHQLVARCPEFATKSPKIRIAPDAALVCAELSLYVPPPEPV
jgi:hypothetical protein